MYASAISTVEFNRDQSRIVFYPIFPFQAMNAEMEQQINAASSLISFMSQPAENGHGGHNENWTE